MHDSLVINCGENNGSSDKVRIHKVMDLLDHLVLEEHTSLESFKRFRAKQPKKFNELKKNFPMKVLCLLLGFYCATVIATSIGWTGDWDILSAGLAVTIVEATGALMY